MPKIARACIPAGQGRKCGCRTRRRLDAHLGAARTPTWTPPRRAPGRGTDGAGCVRLTDGQTPDSLGFEHVFGYG